MTALIKCPKCEVWALPKPDEAWCSEHGAIPIPEAIRVWDDDEVGRVALVAAWNTPVAQEEK